MPKLSNLIKVIKKIKNWPSYLLDFWFNERGLLKYVARDGNKYYIRGRTDDRYILNEIAVHEIYNPSGFKIKPTDIVLDIGAHIGVFSLYASKRANQGKVISFEPMPKNFNHLVRHLELNNVKNVIAINSAVSNKNGKSKFFVDNKENTGRHSLYFDNENKETIIVNTVKLSDVLKKYKIKKINFLKMDCEGAEYDILFSLPKSIINNIDKIAMEYHNIDKKRNVEYLIDFLTKNGFRVNVKQPILFATRI